MQKGTANPAAGTASSIFSTFSSFIKTDLSQPRTVTPLPSMVGGSCNSGDFFIRMSLDLLLNSKELKRNEALKNAIAAALDALDHPESCNPLDVFKPFRMVCQSENSDLTTIAIDCLGKLFTYNYWKFAAGVHVEHQQQRKPPEDTEVEADGDNDGTSEMIAFVINTICDSFIGEITEDKVQLQIIKALQAALTNSDSAFSLHGAILLKAIRTTYNIFLLSKSTDVQTIAQGTVLQMVQTVLGRIPIKKSDMKMSSVLMEGNCDREFKDAFKVFRTLCVLSVKAIPTPEGTVDLRSQPIRSKLLALHLLSSVVKSHSQIFFLPAKALWPFVKQPTEMPEAFRFIDSVKEFLILSLTRNATSIILPIFEVSMELFGRIWTSLRPLLKKEMSVFFTEIVIPILEGRKSIQWYQRHCLLRSLTKIFSHHELNDAGQMLVEIYLNYDCDAEATAKENIWERMIDSLSKITSQHVEGSGIEQPLIQCYVNRGHGIPALTTNNLVPLTRDQVKELFSVTGNEEELRKQAVLFLCAGVLKNLQEWCKKRSSKSDISDGANNKQEGGPQNQQATAGDDSIQINLIQPINPLTRTDDPTAIGNLKQKKDHLIEGIKRFNTNPKTGIQYFLETGCLGNKSPESIAQFLLSTDGLNKTMIGDYLGEGVEENIAIMHAFVEQLEFSGKGFVDALRDFLQTFRLPGEAQKIDRFMLKFAEIYLKGNPTAFSSADAAYVLAYSVIMLNTDQHNTQVKKKMTKMDFIKNNRGIDGGKDWPEEMLGKVFDDIATNEIIMKHELPAKLSINTNDSIDAKNSLALRSENMALKTEQLMRNKGSQNNTFITASHFAHVKPMFQRIWMSVLTGLTTPLQESEDVETVMACLDGIRYSVHISCFFDLELEKSALLSSLGKFTLLNNVHEMREKNIEAIRTLLDIAYQERGNLGTSWKDIVVCISQLEKLQLVGESNSNEPKNFERKKDGNNCFVEEAAAVAKSQMMTLVVDKIFTASSQLSGAAIVHFVRALCEVSFDEISTSVNQGQPRMYCLQRLVEISYYNMNRIRVEWSNIWAILGNHFNQVGCYPNTNVALFALDKLRQLAIKFLELEELPNFKFQKDFLRPFEDIVKNNPDPKIKDMCLVCLQQIIQVKGSCIKSGWKTLCGSLIRVAREMNEQILQLGFNITISIQKNNFESLITNSSLHDYVACIVEYARNRKNPKISLQSVDLIKQCIQKIIDSPTTNYISKALVVSPSAENISRLPNGNDVNDRKASVPPEDDICIRLWMPVLFGLHDIIMASDLEVRTKALSYLFDTLKAQGQSFSISFWDLLSKGVLFPIFDDMKQSSDNTNSLNSKFSSKEELSIWLSTTLIQALRQFVDLFTAFYHKIGFLLPNMFSLMKCCLLHENEALSRIGSTCIQQLVERNAQYFDDQSWKQLGNLFTELNEETAPTFLFFNYKEGDLSSQFPFMKKPLAPLLEKKEFQKQIAKCVMHLMVIQTLQDVILTGPNDLIFKLIPNVEILNLLNVLQSSYELAHVFNDTLDLRQALYKQGYMKQLPNLLKQETMSVNAYLTILIKIFSDTTTQKQELHEGAQSRLIPLCVEIIEQYHSFDSEARKRNLSAWRPVILNILTAFSKFDEENFKLHIQKFYSPAIKILLQEMTPDVRQAIYEILARTGKLFGLIDLNGIGDSASALHCVSQENNTSE